jgi:hypothetical protein
MTLLSMPRPAGLRGLLPGWAISLVIHAAALAWLLHAVPARRQDDTPERRATLVMVRLAPPPRPAQQPAEPAAAPAPAARPAPAAHAAASRPRPARATLQAIAPSPAAAEATPEPAAPAAEPSDGAPSLDMAALRATARAVARSEAAAVPGTQLKATQDEKLGRDIDRSRRGDCQTKYAGAGILAVIPLAVATVTGTGCKWR